MAHRGSGWHGERERHRLAAIQGRLRFAAPSKSERMLLAGSYNAFGIPGTIVKNPPATIRLEGSKTEYGIGGGAPDPSLREAAEWLYMWEKGITFGEVGKAVQNDDPILVISSTKGIKRVHASGLRVR